MAKQVLDLYELYNLVVARGGLVEVINKKQWQQEIIKGLNLPSSITSAAFTLRTQYTKYLYPYECREKNLSNPNDLQSAIDSNRREGRRSGYESYNMFPPRPHIPLPPSSLQMSLPMGQMPLGPLPPNIRPHLNGSPFSHGPNGDKSPPMPGNPLSALEMTRMALWKMYNQAGLVTPPGHGPPHMPRPPLPPLPPGLDIGRAMAEQQARAMQAVREVEKSREVMERRKEREMEEREREREEMDVSPPPMNKDKIVEIYEGKSNGDTPGSPRSQTTGTNIKISSRGESAAEESSLVVSLEINSVMYQGVLFAQPISSSNINNGNRQQAKDNHITIP